MLCTPLTLSWSLVLENSRVFAAASRFGCISVNLKQIIRSLCAPVPVCCCGLLCAARNLCHALLGVLLLRVFVRAARGGACLSTIVHAVPARAMVKSWSPWPWHRVIGSQLRLRHTVVPEEVSRCILGALWPSALW